VVSLNLARPVYLSGPIKVGDVDTEVLKQLHDLQSEKHTIVIVLHTTNRRQ